MTASNMRWCQEESLRQPSSSVERRSTCTEHLIAVAIKTYTCGDVTVVGVTAQGALTRFKVKFECCRISQFSLHCTSTCKSSDDSRDLILYFLEVHLSTCSQFDHSKPIAMQDTGKSNCRNATSKRKLKHCLYKTSHMTSKTKHIFQETIVGFYCPTWSHVFVDIQQELLT